eukprot:CAMPEP_0114511264 /NCGR_PEP_ID=MMETSP0109-20121206/14255_1 /TAXON_ID=29199 /ORGANISM="Chlorarachnion reptans, Strain CCCM449" /LENGTH=138 /DNA_ID=CAMNT_0001690681 /DNA_START=75 /DNA_END=491 /DNA_ORIENTATION=+
MAEPGGGTEKCMFVMRTLGVLVGLMLIGYGTAMLFVGSTQNIRGYIANVYLACFGILIILAEVRMAVLLTYFKFLRNGFGLGGFYIFVGFMALSSDWWCYIVLAICAAVGVTYCGAACMCNDPLNEAEQNNKPPGAVA